MATPIQEVIGVFGILFLGCFLVGIPMEFLCKEHNEPCKPLEYMIDDRRVDSKHPINNTDVILPFSLCNEKLPVIDFQKPSFPCVMLKDRYKMEKFMVTYQIRNFTVYNLDSLTGTKVLEFGEITGSTIVSRYESKLVPTPFEDKEVPYPSCKPNYIGKCFDRVSLESQNNVTLICAFAFLALIILTC